jgi:hypothetical protein
MPASRGRTVAATTVVIHTQWREAFVELLPASRPSRGGCVIVVVIIMLTP